MSSQILEIFWKHFRTSLGNLFQNFTTKQCLLLFWIEFPSPIPSFLENHCLPFPHCAPQLQFPLLGNLQCSEAALRSPDTISSPGCQSVYWNIFLYIFILLIYKNQLKTAASSNWSESAKVFQTAREWTDILPISVHSSVKCIKFYILSDKSFRTSQFSKEIC